MKKCEVRAVKHRLEMYKDLLEMALEKDREASRLQAEYEDLAGAQAISYGPKEGGSGKEKTTIYHEIFSLQQEAIEKAMQYRYQAHQIRCFIEQIEDEDKEILKMAYIDGMRYWQIGEKLGYSTEAIFKKIMRGLEKIPYETAEACGLL